jgi:hypothetical protein
MVGQFTALKSLTICWEPGHTYNFTDSQWQALSCLRCLTSLDLGVVQMVDFSPLTHLTQLNKLSLQLPETSPVQHPEALTHLTALAVLDLGVECSGDFSMHNSLAHVVRALSSLQELTLLEVTPGPWTDTLQRLTGLTQLKASKLHRQEQTALSACPA